MTFLAPTVASYACYLFLHEPFPRAAQFASLVSLLGVILIARPTSFFSRPPAPPVDFASNTTAPAYDAAFPIPTGSQRLSAVAVAMLGVLGSAGAFTSIRWVGNRAHALVSVNYFAVWCVLVSTLALTLSRPLHISDLHFALPAGFRQWGMLLFLGVCGFIMQFLLTKGLAAGGRGGGARATVSFPFLLCWVAVSDPGSPQS
jgi:drug/metabolite transporter (DMT)-like permease